MTPDQCEPSPTQASAGVEQNAARTSLPFYPDYELVPCDDGAGMALHGLRQTIVLDWTNEPIYALNETGALALDSLEKQVGYARFLFDKVRGTYGTFTIAEPEDHVAWLPSATGAIKEAVRSQLQPLRLEGIDADGFQSFRGTVLFYSAHEGETALFETDIKLAMTELIALDPNEGVCKRFIPGEIVLCNETLLLDDLPIEPKTRPVA